jgi:hypothetical protein
MVGVFEQLLSVTRKWYLKAWSLFTMATICIVTAYSYKSTSKIRYSYGFNQKDVNNGG